MSFLEGLKHVHFVGIGGIGMSGLARLMQAKGLNVSGSDLNASNLTRDLQEEGLAVFIGHEASQLLEDTDLLVYSEGVPEDNVERRKATELGIEQMNYFEALGEVVAGYHLVAIAGTHGKSTTTAMLGLILERGDLDPTVLVGTKLREFGGKNLRFGESELFVLEACEYRENFLSLHPQLLGVLNMEWDHMDYFKDFSSYRAAFDSLAAQSEETVWPDEVFPYDGELGVPGEHNRENAGMAAYLARRLGVSDEVIRSALADFSGTWRRFEYKGTWNGAKVYDDYAHHPTAIAATLEAARELFPEERLIVVFQPHQHSRTAQLLDDFSDAFGEADEVIIPNIYAARDSQNDMESVSAEDLVEAIAGHHHSVWNGHGLEETRQILAEELQEGDVLFLMGAGDVNQILDPKFSV